MGAIRSGRTTGSICTGETYKSVVKMTFAKGASLTDPSGLFNSSLEGNVRRAIDFHEGDKLDEKALKALIRAAVALNKSSSPRLVRAAQPAHWSRSPADSQPLARCSNGDAAAEATSRWMPCPRS